MVWLTALGIGLLIGLVRERAHPQTPAVAGIRTHTLVALAGAVSWTLGPWIFLATLCAVAMLVWTGYRARALTSPGLTGEVALLSTCLLAGLTHESPALAAALAVGIAVMLRAKVPVHRFSREAIREEEVTGGLLLAASALIALPLLPERPIDPWGALNLAALWRVVVLVMAVNFLGHIATRILGHRWGLAVAGLFAGFVSSVVSVADMGRRHRQLHQPILPCLSAALLANLSSLTLLLLVILATSPSLAARLAAPLLAGAGLLLLCATVGLGRAKDASEAPVPPAPIHVGHAFGLAGLIGGTSLLAIALRHWVGDESALVTAVVIGAAEAHSATASIAQLSLLEGVALELCMLGVFGVLATSAMTKTVLALGAGGVRYALGIGGVLSGMLVACVGVALWTDPAFAAWLLGA